MYGEQKDGYEAAFKKLKKNNTTIKNLCSIPGIAEINAAKIYSRVIEAKRFENKYKYWSYCGLAEHEKESGGKKYGKKRPRFSRILKGVYKIAATTSISGKNDVREYYEYLIKEKLLSGKEAKNQIARYIAKASYAVMKNNQRYKPYSWRKPTQS